MDQALFNAYLKKPVKLDLRNAHLTLDVSQTLFSSHQVDIGTLHLLRTLEDNLPSAPVKILDIGCGYGPIGLSLGRLLPSSDIHLVDRDALALAFARHNATLNHIDGVSVYGSLGYDDVTDHDFDLIVSNIPGKAGDSVIRALLTDAQYYLAPGGRVAIVVVTPLESLVRETLMHPGIKILHHETMAGHAVFHYSFNSPPEPGDALPTAFDRGVYDRETLDFTLDQVTMAMQTAYGLPEFDTLSFATGLLIKVLQELEIEHVDRAAVFQPGQGHLPLVLWQLFEPRTLHLVDRDLLSLQYAQLNLRDNGCAQEQIRLHHQICLVPELGDIDLVAGILREEEGPEAIEQILLKAASSLISGGHLLIASGSTPITRVLKSKELGRWLRLCMRKRHKGDSVALFVRR